MRRIRRASDLSVQVADQIRAAILRGEFCPGSRVRQEELAARLTVSRAPVRQALVILEREGLVQTDRARGTIVTPLDATLIRDLYGFRQGIERYVAETLARRTDMTWTTIREIVTVGREAAARDDLSAHIDLDLRFHTGLYDLLGNRILSDVMRGQWTNMRRVITATLTISGYPRQIWDEHTAILEAMEAHDAERAGSLAAAHTAAASVRLVEGLMRDASSLLPQQRQADGGG